MERLDIVENKNEFNQVLYHFWVQNISVTPNHIILMI